MRVPLRIFRARPGQPSHRDLFLVEVPERAYVLDAIELAWAHLDRSLMFRHACHHGSCGSCAVRIQGHEKLPCITPLKDVWHGKGELRIDPLSNFPVVGDLVVDVGALFERLAASEMTITHAVGPGIAPTGELPEGIEQLTRFQNCLECGVCVSACPTMASNPHFFGPAGLAAVHSARLDDGDTERARRLLRLVDSEHGIWRCHEVWECSEVCPQGNEPAWRIMDLRRVALGSMGRGG